MNTTFLNDFFNNNFLFNKISNNVVFRFNINRNCFEALYTEDGEVSTVRFYKIVDYIEIETPIRYTLLGDNNHLFLLKIFINILKMINYGNLTLQVFVNYFIFIKNYCFNHNIFFNDLAIYTQEVCAVIDGCSDQTDILDNKFCFDLLALYFQIFYFNINNNINEVLVDIDNEYTEHLVDDLMHETLVDVNITIHIEDREISNGLVEIHYPDNGSANLFIDGGAAPVNYHGFVFDEDKSTDDESGSED